MVHVKKLFASDYTPSSLLWLHFYTTSEILLKLLLSHCCESTWQKINKNLLHWSIKNHNFSYLALPRILGRWQSPQGGRTG